MARTAFTGGDEAGARLAPKAGDWQALRGELVALLSQVELHYDQEPPTGEAAESVASKARALRSRVSPHKADKRHRDALRSVQRAVARFSDRDDAPAGKAEMEDVPENNPQMLLQAASESLRAKPKTVATEATPVQGEPLPKAVLPHPADKAASTQDRIDKLAQSVELLSARLQDPTPAKQIDELTKAVRTIAGRLDARPEPQAPATAELLASIAERMKGAADLEQIEGLAAAVASMSARLERFEGEMRKQIRRGADTSEIGVQVTQLSKLVESLAGKVGETGQFSKLETQIASLNQLMEKPQAGNMPGLASRLDELAATVEKLADLQLAGAEEEEQLLDEIAEVQTEALAKVETGFNGLTERVEKQSGSMHAIESSVRAIYDRIDSIEKRQSLSPADLDRLTQEMSGFTKALRQNTGATPAGLIERLDTLNARIAQIEDEDGGAALFGLKADVETLRKAVGEALEPRFAALQTQLAALNDRVATDRPNEHGFSQLEAQIRLLVTRMDEAGAQLNGLAELYSDRTVEKLETLPQFDALADMVARRTSQEVTRALAGTEVSVSEQSLSALEQRMSRFFDGSRSADNEQFGGVKDGIQRVDERLERLEHALKGLNAPGEFQREDASPDPMPMEPADEEPLLMRSFDAVSSTQLAEVDQGVAATPATSRRGQRKARAYAGLDAEPSSTVSHDPQQAEVSLAQALQEALSAPTQAQPRGTGNTAQGVPHWSPTGENTFSAAKRRAAMQKAEASAQEHGNSSNRSAFGRAFSRFGRDSAGSEPSSFAATQDDPARSSQPDNRKRAHALTRHRRPMILASALLGLSLLTLNLVHQRLSSEPAASLTQTTAGQAEPEGSLLEPGPATELVAAASTLSTEAPTTSTPATDPIEVGAIDPSTTRTRTADLASSPMPSALDTEIQTASIPAADAEPDLPESPVAVEAPPEAIGPEALRNAAANGDARAQFEIGAIYTEGVVVPQDFSAAAKWYERAAAQGFGPAAYRLGNLYENGQGVAKDLLQARLWYQRAAEAGNRMSMHNLAALYANGSLGSQDFPAAAEWFENAAERGMTDSQFNLGMLYARGLGVEQDLDLSFKWFSLAAMSGDADAVKARDDIAASLDAESAARIQQEVANWNATRIEIGANYAPIGTWAEDFDPGQPIDDQAVVQKVQQALVKLGYDIGQADGMMGRMTEEAIRAFERATGMSESGKVNPRLLAVLGSQPV